MVRIEIVTELKDDILKKFQRESKKIFKLMMFVGNSPKKGKFVAKIGKVAIKELKYKSFWFYFLVDAYKVKFFGVDELKSLLIKFIRMGDKNNQQKVIKEIKDFLRKFG